MTENFDYCLAHVLKSEGGYVNHPKDPGGRTNLGVTQKVWEDWVGKASSEEEMKALTKEMVAPLYKARYWDKVRGDDLPSGLDLCVFDLSVNSGVFRAASFLQRILGAKEDGVIGPKTLALIKPENALELVKEYSHRRRMFIRGLATYATFGKGWENRINKVEADAILLVAPPQG